MSSVFDMGSPAAIFAAVAASAAMKYMAGVLLKKPKNQFRYVGKVGEIWVFPVKSMRGILVKEANVEQLGLEYNGIGDRLWVVTKPNGKFMCQRQYPKMVLIQQSFQGEEIELQAPGMEPLRFPAHPKLDESKIRKVTVWDDTVDALDMGDEVSNWLSRYLKVDGARLGFSESSLEKRDAADVDKPWKTYTTKGDTTGFPDFCSYMILSQESVDFLNTKLSTPVPISNFRPNIVVHDCQPFDEDTWSSIRIGDSQLRGLYPCTRCTMPTVNQSTGTKHRDGEPLATLKKIRMIEPYDSPCFGCNYAYDKSGTIRIGDPVYAMLRD